MISETRTTRRRTKVQSTKPSTGLPQIPLRSSKIAIRKLFFSVVLTIFLGGEKFPLFKMFPPCTSSRCLTRRKLNEGHVFLYPSHPLTLAYTRASKREEDEDLLAIILSCLIPLQACRIFLPCPIVPCHNLGTLQGPDADVMSAFKSADMPPPRATGQGCDVLRTTA